MPPHRLDRGGQLARAHEQVVDEPGLADRGEPALDVVAEEPRRVGLVVHLMPIADQRAVELRSAASTSPVRSTQPTTPSDERRRGRDREQLLRLVERVARLHDDGAVDAVLVAAAARGRPGRTGAGALRPRRSSRDSRRAPGPRSADARRRSPEFVPERPPAARARTAARPPRPRPRGGSRRAPRRPPDGAAGTAPPPPAAGRRGARTSPRSRSTRASTSGAAAA